MMGRKQEAESTITRLQQRRSERYSSAALIAQCYAGLGVCAAGGGAA